MARAVPASLKWLALLVATALAVALIAGAAIFIETRAERRTRVAMITGGDWKRGEASIARRGCGSCHVIPGIPGANGKVGPDLTHIGQRVTLAGSFPNDPAVMVHWLMHPQEMRPGSGMPEQGIGEQEAKDISAYLY